MTIKPTSRRTIVIITLVVALLFSATALMATDDSAPSPAAQTPSTSSSTTQATSSTTTPAEASPVAFTPVELPPAAPFPPGPPAPDPADTSLGADPDPLTEDPEEPAPDPVPTPGLVPDVGLTANPPAPSGATIVSPGHPGCAVQCITRALLRATPSGPDLSLDIRTHTLATLSVFVSEEGWLTVDGVPHLGDESPLVADTTHRTSWTPTLEGLAYDTKYWVAVTATDDAGNTAARVGRMTTRAAPPTAIADPSGPAGCGAACITTAVAHPGDGLAASTIEVRSHTPAAMSVWVSTEPPATATDGHPYFPGLAPADSTDGSLESAWTAHLDGLSPATTYYGVVAATDAEGRSSYQAGTFGTAAGPDLRITFHHIRVVDDGDHGGNRGELTFSGVVDGEEVFFIDERKYSTRDTVQIGERGVGRSLITDGSGEILPLIEAGASERDATGEWGEFCRRAPALRSGWGQDDECDAQWNSAGSGIRFVRDLPGMPRCEPFDLPLALDDDACLLLIAPDVGSGYPQVNVVVSIEVL